MGYENEQSKQSNVNFAQPGAINTVTIVDEPEENTIIYSWRDCQLKKLPYQENNAQTGQKIKTFMSFNSKEKVVIVNVNKEQMCLTVEAGVIENNGILKSADSTRYYCNNFDSDHSAGCIHKVPLDIPILIFSIEHINFGQEIKGKIVRENNISYRKYELPFGKYVFAGVITHKNEMEIFGSYQVTVEER